MRAFFKQEIELSWRAGLLAAVLFVIGGVSGYGLSLNSELNQDATLRRPGSMPQVAQVLGAHDRTVYANPFDVLDVKQVRFPILQLKGCRNHQECYSYCSAVDNYQACAAWSKSLE